MSVIHNIVPSPIGNLTIVVNDDKLVGLYQDGQSNYPIKKELGSQDINDVISETAKQLKEYFSGERAVFELPLGDADTEFREVVLNGVREVPYGAVVTYGDLAEKVGKVSATTYVAGALNANKITIVIPCHRIIGLKSSRYAADVKNKEFLQSLEAKHRSKFENTTKKKGFLSRLFG